MSWCAKVTSLLPCANTVPLNVKLAITSHFGNLDVSFMSVSPVD